MVNKLKYLITIKGNCNLFEGCIDCYWYNKERFISCILYDEWMQIRVTQPLNGNNNFPEFVMNKSIKELREVKLKRLNEDKL